MGVREGDCRTRELFVLEPAQEVISSSGSSEAGSYLLCSSGCSCSHGGTGVGDKVHIQGVGIPLGIKSEIVYLAVGIREVNCGA